MRFPLRCVLGTLILASAAAGAPRPLQLEDYARMQALGDPVCSADGRWVAYTVQSVDAEADEQRSSVWMVGMEGGEPWRLSGSDRSAEAPRFSPDGRYVSFLASRGEDKTQLFLLDRRGGEPQPLTGITGSIREYDWSPDGRRLVLAIAHDDEEGAGAHVKVRAPIVIDALHFKEDRLGYLSEADRPQLYLYDLRERRLEALTTDRRVEDQLPVFSPDGRAIAYISGHADPYRTGKREIYLIEPRPGAEPRLVTEFFAPNALSLHFTPDARRLIYAVGLEPRLNAYIEDKLMLVDLGTRRTSLLAAGLDRPLHLPAVLSADALVAAVEDDGSQIAVKVPLGGGPVEHLTEPGRVVSGLCAGGGRIAALVTDDSSPPELFALESGRLRKLSGHNDALMSELALGAVEEMRFASRDGTSIYGMIVKPPDFHAGKRYPTILWIHGGPNGQDAHQLSFDNYSPELERQWFAAHGYVALAVNYRGTSGRGAAFARSIAADWGDREVADLHAAVDYAVHAGLADPERLGVGGWSYGGILTDYAIANDTRFKAAIAGAGSADQIAMYGSDEYVMQYNAELGPPWRATDRWLRVSYPFFHADRIRTPTLFMGGERDFNVPIGGGEQMYEALRTLGVPTRLVIYPGQFHVFTRPSYIRDRLQRYLDWYDGHLNGTRP